MKLISVVAISIACSLATKAAAETPKPDNPVWSVGAGVGFGYSLGSLGQLAGGSGSLTNPRGIALVEYRATKSLALFVSADALHFETHVENTPPEDAPDLNYPRSPAEITTEVGGSLGARWIINPDGIVEVSPSVQLDASWRRERGGSHENPRRYTTLTYGMSLGLVLEYQLLEQLFLRLNSPIMAARIGSGTRLTGRDESQDKRETTEYFAGLSLAPTLQIRFLF